MLRRPFCAHAVAMALCSTFAPSLHAQHYVEVSIESSPGAADFDSQILGHVQVDQSRRTGYSGTFNRLPTPTDRTGTIHFASTTQEGIALYFKAFNPSTAARSLDAQFETFSPDTRLQWRYRNDTADRFRGNTDRLSAELTIDPDDLDGGAMGPLDGDWQIQCSFDGDAITQWTIASANAAENLSVPAVPGRRIRIRNAAGRQRAYPATTGSPIIEVTVDANTVPHSGIVPIDPANDALATLHMLSDDASLQGNPAVAIYSAFSTSARPRYGLRPDGLYLWGGAGLVPVGTLQSTGVTLGTLPVGALPVGTSVFAQGVVLTPGDPMRDFVVSEGVELRLATGATRRGNSSPVASAGIDQNVFGNAWVGLDALESRDADSDQRIEFAWRQLNNGAPNVSIEFGNTPGAFFRAPDVTQPTELTFEVLVSDGFEVTTDQVSVFVDPAQTQFEGARSLRPYRDTLTRAEATHLLRRAGFGGRPTEIEAAVAAGLTATLDDLFTFTPSPQLETDMRAVTGTPRYSGDSWGQQDVRYRQALAIAMVKSPNPLRERMAYFWHDLHATAMVGGANREEATIGRHIEMLRRNMNPTGDAWRFDYREHLLALSRDGLMLRFLDGDVNIARSPNENYSREFFELYTLGEPEVSGVRLYTERDVLEAARAFTGWRMVRVGPNSPAPEFVPARHDSGNKTVFGVVAPFDDAGIVDLVLNQKQTEAAAFLVRKLFEHLVGFAPTAAQVTGLSTTLINGNWQVPPVVRRILQSEAMFSGQARYARIKTPIEFAVVFQRAMLADGVQQNAQLVDRAAERMGHLMFEPPSPAGWEDGLAWISEGSLALRLFAMTDMSVPRTIAEDTQSHSAAGTVAYLADRLDLEMTRADFATMVEYANTMIDLDGEMSNLRFDQRNQNRLKLPRLAGLLANHPSFHRN